ncbi:MAG: sulfatase-like hydrolase/transferase [Coriobacteriales bacterium]|jgi:hypothetical protein|nr:sulfatase-like hydrolase/transferase [Coriobacteriales bacterium]
MSDNPFFSSKRRRVAYLGFLCLVCYFGFPATAWAYIDPATTSYIIQIVSGLIISLSVAFGVFASRLQMGAVTLKARAEALWMRMRNSRYRQLYAKARAQEKARQKAARKSQPRISLAEYLFKDKRRFRVRVLLAALLACGFSFSFVFFGILDILIMNRESMPYPVTLVFSTVALLALAVFAVLFVFLLLLRGRVFTAVASLVLAATLVLYVQGNFLNGSLGQLTGDWLDLGQILPDVIGNTVLCVLIFALPFLIWRFAPRAYQTLLIFIPSLLIGMQLIALITSVSTTGVLEEKLVPERFLSEEGLYEVAPENNIIVIVLDRLDQRYIDELLSREPDYFGNNFDGFTRYTNNMATTSRTFPSIINMLTGYRYDFDVPAEDYMREAWGESEFLPALRAAGLRSDLYTEYTYAYLDGNDLSGAADNLDEGLPAVDGAAVENLVLVSCYRYMPYILKPYFWISTGAIQDDVVYQGERAPRYYADDHAVYDTLTSSGLEVRDELSGNFKFIHLNGCHPPFNAGYDFEIVPRAESSEYLQTRFAFALVFEYLDCLRELGLYEDSTIIVTGDHGYTVDLDYLGDFQDLSEAQTTGLFVKLSGEQGTALKESAAPVNSDRLRATVWQQAGLDQSELGPTYSQVPLDSDEVKGSEDSGEAAYAEYAEKPRTFSFQVGLSGSQEKYLQYFEVRGDANDFSNWKEVGRLPMRYYHGYQGD